MLLQPADFYSYSRATGTKPPENDRERAAMAPDVIDFKRSQLKAPSPDSDEGRDIGLVALGAGILGSIIGGRQIARRTAQTLVETFNLHLKKFRLILALKLRKQLKEQLRETTKS